MQNSDQADIIVLFMGPSACGKSNLLSTNLTLLVLDLPMEPDPLSTDWKRLYSALLNSFGPGEEARNG